MEMSRDEIVQRLAKAMDEGEVGDYPLEKHFLLLSSICVKTLEDLDVISTGDK